jgi:hypothetical protein
MDRRKWQTADKETVFVLRELREGLISFWPSVCFESRRHCRKRSAVQRFLQINRYDFPWGTR